MVSVNDFFCGAGGMGLGFKQAGFRLAGAWDIDKWSVQSYGNNISPKVKQEDITQMTWQDVPYADVWTFGSPCQAFSVAGKQLGMDFECPNCGHVEQFDGEMIIDRHTPCTKCGIQSKPRDPRGLLFFEIMRLLKEVKTKAEDRLPPIILLENVKGIAKFLDVIAYEYEKRGYEMYYTLYNSKYWGVPQNRERYFILGVHHSIEKDFRFREQQTNYVPNLYNVLETEVDEKYFISDKIAREIIEEAQKRVDLEGLLNYFNTKRSAYIAVEPHLKQVGMLDIKGHDHIKRVYDPEGICPALTTMQGGNQQPKIIIPYPTLKDGTSYAIITRTPSCYTQHHVERKSATLILEGGKRWRVRKLTPRECFRLQGFPDSYNIIVSDTQAYKQAGNAVTVPIAKAIAEDITEFLK